MGRHAADDGASVHPIVAAALDQRPALDEPAQPKHLLGSARAADERQGGLGWPGEPGDGTGLGWPADATSAPADSAGEDATLPTPDDRPARRRGWRRWFGSGQGDAPARSSSAA